MLHPLLTRQLKRLGLGREVPTEAQWTALLTVVGATYREAEQDRELVERAMMISSAEMRELYDNLEQASRTSHVAHRDQLLATNAVKAAVLEASPDGMLVIGERREVVLYNHQFLEIWRIPEEVRRTGQHAAFLAYTFTQLVDPVAFRIRIDELYADPTASSEDEIELLDGRVIERCSRPIMDADGTTRGRLWSFRDVTARRRDEANLRSAHAFLDSIFETLPNMVFVKEASELRFVRFNRAGEELLGVERDRLIGHSDHELFPAEQADSFVAADRVALAQAKTTTIAEEQIETSRGMRYLRTRKIPIAGADGRPAYLLGISEDITEERARSAELYLAKERAETASRVKSDFLLNMSHELRTPLNAILGFARVLGRSAKGRLDADEEAYLRDIVVAGEHMLQLVNDLLDLRSLEAQALEVAPTELLPPLHEAIRMIQPLAREREQTLAVDISPDLPRCLGERRAIVQVLVNLMTNATKFTPKGGRLAIRARGDHGMVQLEVADTGCGISSEDQHRLFQYFEQLGAKQAMKGSGVGLALTRALVEKMGGAISVASVVGDGTTFSVRLRCADA